MRIDSPKRQFPCVLGIRQMLLNQRFITSALLIALTVGSAPVMASVARAATPALTSFAQVGQGGAGPIVVTRHLTVVAGLKGVQFRPKGDNAIARILASGSILRATGRSADGQLLYVEADGATGWIATEEVIAFGIDAIPVREKSTDSENINATGATSTETTSSSSSTDNSSTTTETTMAASGETAPGEAAPGEAVPIEVPVAETASVISSRLNVRSGPGVTYDVVTQVVAGDELVIIGRNQDEGWLQVVIPAADGRNGTDNLGWVSARFVQSGASISSVSKVTAPALADQPATPASPTSPASPASASPAGLSGTLVFQQSIGGQISVYKLDSGALWPLTTGAEPALSPDGSTVAFTRTDGLYVIDIDGANERNIFSGREGLGSPKWSPDGGTIIFTRGDEWLACVKGGNRERCSEDNEVGEGKYKKIMYAIAAVEADGSYYRDVVSTKPARAPDWTSGGIIYQSIDGLQLTSVDRDAVNTLIDYDYLDPFYYDPDWQPGGNQIVFESNEGSHWQIFSINTDGSDRHALTRPRTALVDRLPSSVAPAFSPDGRYIVYLSNILASGEAGEWKLWVMNADGSNQRPLPIDLTFEYTFGVEQVVSWR